MLVVQVDAFIVESKSLHLSCNDDCCTSSIKVLCRILSRILSKELQKTVSFMGDLYWSSLANSFMDYYWFNLLKHNCFRHGVTVLRPKCYTLEVELGTSDTVYNTNIAQLREPGSCIPPLPILKL